MKDKISKLMKPWGIIFISILLFVIIVMIWNFVMDRIIENNLKDIDWIRGNVEFVVDDAIGDNVYVVKKDERISAFNMKYQQVVDENINSLIEKNEYTVDNPLLIVNPYGTNNLGVNIYFKTDEDSSVAYTISIDDSKIGDFSRTLKNDGVGNYTSEHQYQLIGFVPGYENEVELVVTNRDGEEEKNKFFINMENIICKSDTILDSVDGESKSALTDGLYVLFGLDKAFKANSYVYDNDGVLRADLVLADYRSDRIIFDDGNMYYSYNNNGIAKINRLGKVEKKYILTGYEMHHDYVLDSINNKFLVLVNSKDAQDETIEDLIISVDLDSGEIEEVVDMKDVMPSIYEEAQMPESGRNTYGGTGLDWIHLNSLSVVNDKGDIVISGREISTVIYLEDIYNNPKLKYLIAEEEVYKDTEYANKVLTKVGDFVAQAGQHTITYVSDDNLEAGQYYLEMYNNNYGSSNTRKSFPWDEYPGVGTYKEGEKSKYYKYLVDENEKTFTLVESFDVPYSSIVSSIQDVDYNHVTSSGMSNCYNEYDSDGTLIRQFNYSSKKYAYRVFKYKFNGTWFV